VPARRALARAVGSVHSRVINPHHLQGDAMAGFVQIIEFESSRVDEIRALGEEAEAQNEQG